MNQSAARAIAALLVATLLFQAGATSPAFVLADEPPASPPAATFAPSPTPEAGTTAPPSPDPTAQPEPNPTDLPPLPDATPGVELIELRTASSRTFEQADGTFLTEYYGEDLFYKPDASGAWEPIEARFLASDAPGVAARVERSPVQIALSAADAAEGFLSLSGGVHTISFGLPEGTPAGRAGGQPVIAADGLVADYVAQLGTIGTSRARARARQGQGVRLRRARDRHRAGAPRSTLAR